MSGYDELDRMRRAFEADPPPLPWPASRGAAVAAAMAAYEDAAQDQARAGRRRLKSGRANGPGSWLRRLGMTLAQTMTDRPLLTGTASLAVLALTVVLTSREIERLGTPDWDDGTPVATAPAPDLAPLATTPDVPRAPAAEDATTETRSASGPAERTRPLRMPAPLARPDGSEAVATDTETLTLADAETRTEPTVSVRAPAPEAATARRERVTTMFSPERDDAGRLQRTEGAVADQAAEAIAPGAPAEALAAARMAERSRLRGLAVGGTGAAAPAPAAIGSVEGVVAPRPMPAPAPVADPVPHQWREAGRDRFEAVEDSPVRRVADEPLSTFSIDVDTASYSVMRKALMAGALPPKDAVRIEELVNYFAYDYPLPESAEPPFRADIALLPTPWNARTELLRIGLQGFDLPPAERPRANLVFLIDTSGSMDAPDKLPLLLNAFRLLLPELAPEDSVAIVAYAGSAGVVLEPTPARERGRILDALGRLRAGGSTAGGAGIEAAYALAERAFDPDGTNRVILATDGDFNVGLSDPRGLEGYVERQRAGGVLLSVLGFGRGNYNDALMQALAQSGNGQAAYIDTLAEARKVLVDEMGGTLFPIAKDVKIQVEFNPAEVSEYRLIGYETRALEREDFNNDRVDAGEIGSGHRVTALYEIARAGAGSVDPLRYGSTQPVPQPTDGVAGEVAFLKIRWKRPEGGPSTLVTRPITEADDDPGAVSLREARFAAAVAGFGQLLRGGRHTGGWSYDDALELARANRGPDPHGYRAEFLTLLGLAQSTAGLQTTPR